MFSRLRWTYLAGCAAMLTPPAMAYPHSPRRMLSQARWSATRDEEQAVSTTMLGPRKSPKYETWLAMEERLVRTVTGLPRKDSSAARTA